LGGITDAQVLRGFVSKASLRRMLQTDRKEMESAEQTAWESLFLIGRTNQDIMVDSKWEKGKGTGDGGRVL
jgi:hypothetical protein